MRSFDRGEWNALTQDDTPFMRWEWLDLLETSGAVRPETGWLPAHCGVRAGGVLAGAAPLYLKGHGQAEFVYDQIWADAAVRMDLPYYPKLVAAAPFTPVAGYRFLARSGISRPVLAGAMLEAMDRLAEAHELSGLHVLFARDAFADELEEFGLMTWEHQGFLWENPGYRDFGDFLDRFRAGQRKNIRRERKRLRESGVEVVVVPGADAPASWFSRMYDYYADTNDKFGEWGCKYLPRAFFKGLEGCFRDHLAFSAAFLKGHPDPVGLALLAHGGGALYGRYWGAAQDIPFLHFELCYYAPIEWAIARGLSRFDPGMGGEHKPRRGFSSRITRSLHRFRDPRLASLFAVNIPKINAMTREYIDGLEAFSARRRTGGA
jgi:predicted N-acyltransferase